MRLTRPELHARPVGSTEMAVTLVKSNKGKTRSDKKKKDRKKKSYGYALSNGTSDADGGWDTSETEMCRVHPSVLSNAPEPIKPSLLALRPIFMNAILLIDERIPKLECGVETGNPDGPLCSTDGPKL
jgi:hypothetical protein